MIPNENQFICKLVAGSHLYNLNTSQSDIDKRGIYLTNSLPYLFGLENDDVVQSKDSNNDDYSYFEASRFIQLLKKTNTNSLEVLFAPKESFLLLTKDFELIRKHRMQLVDSQRLLYSSLRGYVNSEIKLALGERTGKLGGKRKEALDKFQYSYKNVSNLIRLVYQMRKFLETGEYPLQLEGAIRDQCLKIKTQPEKYSLDDIKKIVEEVRLDAESIEDKIHLVFDAQLASCLMWEIYSKKFSKLSS